jgi:hypothetical protein
VTAKPPMVARKLSPEKCPDFVVRSLNWGVLEPVRGGDRVSGALLGGRFSLRGPGNEPKGPGGAKKALHFKLVRRKALGFGCSVNLTWDNLGCAPDLWPDDDARSVARQHDVDGVLDSRLVHEL